MSYYFSRVLDDSFDNSIERITVALRERNFGILTEINVKETLKKKLDVEFHRYKILGACNPSFAHKALTCEDKVGTMLPCNVIVQETPDGKTEIAAIDPLESMKAIENDELKKIAVEVRMMLKEAIEKA
jgi:uncharacterized protein (DUF302 family)